MAGQVVLPKPSFSGGETLNAGDLQNNFNTIATEVNNNDTAIKANANSLANKQDAITANCPPGTVLSEIQNNGTVVCTKYMAFTYAIPSVDISSQLSLYHIRINGSTMSAPVAPNSLINVKNNFTLFGDQNCPGCQFQILMGLSHLPPVGCIYDGIPDSGTPPVIGTGVNSVMLAPSEPGTYFLTVQLVQGSACNPSLGWGNTEKTNIGMIFVQ